MKDKNGSLPPVAQYPSSLSPLSKENSEKLILR
jgi:hypothetical protein